MNKKIEKDVKFEYDDEFKEDLMHQLWHLVEEIRKMNENLVKINFHICLVSEEIRDIRDE